MERTRHFEVQLTQRQRQVWRLVAKGHTNGEIAERLGISLDGAKWHVGELLTKLDANSREGLVELWDSRGRGMRGALGGLLSFSWGKAVVGTAAVSVSLVTASVLYVSGAFTDSGASANVRLPAQTAGATLQPEDAYAHALQVAEQRMAEHLPLFLAQPGTTVDDLALVDARLMAPNEGFDPGLDDIQAYRWEPPPLATEGVWVFSWLGTGLGNVEGPLGGTGDVHIDVLLADRAAPEVVAWRAHVQLAPAMPFFGGSGGFNSPAARRSWDAVTHTYHAAELNGGPGGGDLALYRTKDELCYRFSVTWPEAVGSGGCDPATAVMPPAGMVMEGGLSFLGPGEQKFAALVYTSDDVRAIAMLAEDGRSVGPYPTAEIPRELMPAGRAALITSVPFEEPYWLIAYDAAGTEIGRTSSVPHPPGVSSGAQSSAP